MFLHLSFENRRMHVCVENIRISHMSGACNGCVYIMGTPFSKATFEVTLARIRWLFVMLNFVGNVAHIHLPNLKVPMAKRQHPRPSRMSSNQAIDHRCIYRTNKIYTFNYDNCLMYHQKHKRAVVSHTQQQYTSPTGAENVSLAPRSHFSKIYDDHLLQKNLARTYTRNKMYKF